MRIKEDLVLSFLDFPSQEGFAIVVYFTGCSHFCLGCHSKMLQNYNEGKDINSDDLFQKIESFNFSKIKKTNKIVFSGGDPLYIQNSFGVIELSKLLYAKHYDICIYTGFSINEVINLKSLGLKFKYVKVGTFDERKKQISLKDNQKFVLASYNQELYDYDINLISKNGIFYF